MRSVENSIEQILNDALIDWEKRNPHYSLRAFARDLEINAGNLSAIMKGRKGLSEVSAKKLAKKLGFSEAEQKHFVDLALSEFARSKKNRSLAQKKLLSKQASMLPIRELSHEFYELVSDPLHTSVLESLRVKNASQNIQELADSFSVTANRIQDALHRLEKLELIEKMGNRYVTTDSVIKSPTGTPSKALRFHHSEILKKADAALYTQSLDEREFSSTQLCIRKSDLPEMKKYLQAIWKDFASKFAANDDGDAVYELSTQFFKLGQIPKTQRRKT